MGRNGSVGQGSPGLRRTGSRLVLVALVALGLSGCIGDPGTALTFEGREYLGIDPSVFRIDEASLVSAGTADRINIPQGDKALFRLPDLDPSVLLVAFQPDGTIVVFAPEEAFEPGGKGLGVTLPEVCPYLADPEREGCAP